MTLPTPTPGIRQGQPFVVEGEGAGLGPGLSFLLSDFLPEHQAGFEGLQAEECGVLNGCENGRCVRVREGYTCDCFEGFQLDMAHMACVGKFGIRVAMPGTQTGPHGSMWESQTGPLFTLGTHD